MSNRKIRILVNGISNSYGGVESIFYSLLQCGDPNIQLDFISNACNRDLIEMFSNSGSKVYLLPKFRENQRKYIQTLQKIFRENRYDIYHVNLTKYRIPIDVVIAKKAGVKVVLHSHSTQIYKTGNKLKNLFRRVEFLAFKKVFIANSDLRIACSEKAGEFLFSGTDYKILYNGVSYERYAFDEEARRKIRKEINCDDKTKLIGHIGRFSDEKNQEFIVDFFKKVCDESPDFMLLLVGEGVRIDRVQEKVRAFGLDKKVVFSGYRKDIPELLSAMDLFVLPSKHEAFPLSLIEAQVNGLDCIVSDVITHEIDMYGVTRIPLSDDELWKRTILSYNSSERRQKCPVEDQRFNEAQFKDSLVRLYHTLVQ